MRARDNKRPAGIPSRCQARSPLSPLDKTPTTRKRLRTDARCCYTVTAEAFLRRWQRAHFYFAPSLSYFAGAPLARTNTFPVIIACARCPRVGEQKLPASGTASRCLRVQRITACKESLAERARARFLCPTRGTQDTRHYSALSRARCFRKRELPNETKQPRATRSFGSRAFLV